MEFDEILTRLLRSVGGEDEHDTSMQNTMVAVARALGKSEETGGSDIEPVRWALVRGECGCLMLAHRLPSGEWTCTQGVPPEWDAATLGELANELGQAALVVMRMAGAAPQQNGGTPDENG